MTTMHGIYLASDFVPDFCDTKHNNVLVSDRYVFKQGDGSQFRIELNESLEFNDKTVQAQIDETFELYESSMEFLVKKLNSIHVVEHRRRYWESLIGHWCMQTCIITKYFWDTISLLELNHGTIRCKSYKPEPGQCVFDNYLSFFLNKHNPFWEQMLIADIIKARFGEDSVELLDNSSQSNHFEHNQGDNDRWKSILSGLSLALNKVFEKFFPIAHPVVIHGVSYGILDQVRLALKLGQLPVFFKSQSNIVIPNFENHLARSECSLSQDLTGFLHYFLLKSMPRSYLEGFNWLRERVNNMNFPQKPSFIFTSNSFQSDELFKSWAAVQFEAGADYYIHQHGGNYGLAAFNQSERIEINSSDRFLSWGWSDRSNNLASHLKSKDIQPDENGQILILLKPLGSQEVPWNGTKAFKDYLSALDKVQVELQPRLQEKVWFRRYRYSGGLSLPNNESYFIKTHLSSAQFENSHSQLFVGKHSPYKLVVHTFLSSSINEAFTYSFPSLIVAAHPSDFHLRPSAIECFHQLKEVGIFHDNIGSLISFLNQNAKDIQEWWWSESVTKARSLFERRFCMNSENPVNDLASFFKQARAGVRS